MNGIANQLVEIALSDIKASRKLREAKQYPQSVFYFQQSTEKAFKAWGIFAGIIKEDEIQKISHKHIKIYWKALTDQEKTVKGAMQAYDKIEGIKDHEVYKNMKLDEFNKMIEDEKVFKETIEKLDLLNLTHNDHVWVLDHLEEVEKVRLPSFKGLAGKLRDYSLKTEDFTRRISENNAKEFRDEMDKLSDEQLEALSWYPLKEYMISLFVTKVLFFTTIMSAAHFSYCRYPFKGVDPLKFYTSKQPLVKFLPDYLRLLEKAIKVLIKLRAGKYIPKVLDSFK
ncbi:MAG: HEPN domain-containing protein [Bacteroidia bacterium]|nr:HEPN domain-containing protein [Bacteroidia bacterium]